MDASSLVLAVVKCPVQPVRIPSSLSFRWFLCLFYFLPLGDRFPRIIQRHSDSAPLPICFLFFFDGRPTAFFFRRFSPRRVRLFSIFRSPLSFSGLRPLRSSLVWSATTVYKLGFDWISSAYLFFVYIFLWWFNRIVLWGLDRPPRLEPRRLHWMFPVLLSNPSCMRFRFRFLSNSAQFDFFFQVCSHASVGSMIFP